MLPILRGAQLGDWHQDAARSAIRLDGSGAFPRNTELEAELTFASERPAPSIAELLPDGHTMTLRVHHSFVALPPSGFTPRNADPRVGFFGEVFQDHTAPYREPILREYADRWRLEKANPGAAVSPPKQPLVYYLDSGMPETERSIVRRGVLWWNHAFADAGFQNAVEVRDLPPGASLLDVRYSGVAWVNRAERAWSIGQVQTDPRTGEILHAVVILDSHRRRTTARIWENLSPPRTRGACAAADAPDASELVSGPNAPEDSLVFWPRHLAHGGGYTLGLLRCHHLFRTTGLVKDYLGPYLRPRGGGFDLGDAYPHDIGGYHRLCIRWGYTPDADANAVARDAIVRAANARGVVLPADADWRYAEYDVGPDPAAWLRTTREVRRAVLDRFGPAQLEAGRPLYDLQRRFNLAYLYHRFGIQAAQQAVGGQTLNNALAGDGQIPAAWVPDTLQRRCLDGLTACLAATELAIPERVLAAMVPPPSGMSPTRERFASESGDVFSPLSAARALCGLIVRPLLSPERAARLTLRGERGAVSLDEVESRLVVATWDARPETDARLAPLQRVSQRVVLDALLDLAASEDATPEVRAVTTARLESLAVRVRSMHFPDAAGSAHVLHPSTIWRSSSAIPRRASVASRPPHLRDDRSVSSAASRAPAPRAGTTRARASPPAWAGGPFDGLGRFLCCGPCLSFRSRMVPSRARTPSCMVGHVPVGGGASVVVNR